MCEICKRFICPPACPSYDGRSAEKGKRIAVCRVCGAELYADSDFFVKGATFLCKICHRTASGTLKIGTLVPKANA